MKAVILAGGRGTRLEPITFVLPKPLVPLGDIPVMEVVVRQLVAAGFDDITFNLGYLAELIQAFFKQHGDLAASANLRYVVEQQPTGTAGSLSLVDHLRDNDEPFLVMNGDILTNLDYQSLVKQHKASGADLTIATYRKRVQMNLGVLELGSKDGELIASNLNKQSEQQHTPLAPPVYADLKREAEGMPRVIGYREKPETTYPVSMGIYVYSPKVLDFIESGEKLDFPDLVLRLIGAGCPVHAYESDDIWLDIGRPEDYAEAVKLFAEKPATFLPG